VAARYERSKVVGLPPVRGAPHSIFAATVPAAMLLGLDREAIRNALGIASYSAHVPTLRKVLESYDPPMTKYDHMGGMALAASTPRAWRRTASPATARHSKANTARGAIRARWVAIGRCSKRSAATS